jgi:phospholipid N-methyltransferase
MKTDTLKSSNLKKSRYPVLRFAQAAAVFFRGFMDHPRMVASIIPSSKSTIDALLEPVDWERCSLFVEYGPGVGTFSSHILDRLPADGKLLVIDTNPRFIDYLRRSFHDKRFHAVLGSAADVDKFIRATGHAQADYILSGLPFSALSIDQGQHIVAESYSVLREGGAFLTYQFRATARQLTSQRFAKVDTGVALWNVPPCLLTWGWKLSQK